MKTLTEAAQIVKDPSFWQKNGGLAEQIGLDPDVLSCLFAIACSEGPANVKLMQAICCGIAIGMEMEKP